MYRIFTKHRASFHCASTVPSHPIMQFSVEMCSYCNYHHRRKLIKSMVYIQSRTRSTLNPTLNPDQLPLKKKVKNKKYVELLEISNHVTSRRAAIKKLNASDVSILVNQPDITMDKLHRLKEFGHLKKAIADEDVNQTKSNNLSLLSVKSAPNLQQPSHMPNLKEQFNEKAEESYELKCNNRKYEFENLSGTIKKLQAIINANHHLVTDSKFPDIKQIHQKNVSLNDYTHMLTSYIDVYLTAGKVNLAAKALLAYRQKISKKKATCDNAIIIYNQVMEYFASQGDISNVLQLYNAMKMDSIAPIPQTFAYLFETLGRATNVNKLSDTVNMLRSDMDEYKISGNDIFTQSSFKSRQESPTLKGIRLMIPNFKAVYPKPEVECNCQLLNDMNEKEISHPTKNEMFTMDQLQKHMLQQLKAEFKNEVSVESIEKHKDTLETRYCEKLVGSIEEHWRKAVKQAFQRNLRFLKEKERSMHISAMVLHPFMEVLEENEYVDIIMETIKNIAMGSDGYSPSRVYVEKVLGGKIFKRYLNRRLKDTGMLDSTVDIYLTYLKWYVNRVTPDGCNPSHTNHRTVWQSIEYNKRKTGTLVNVNIAKWPAFLENQIGRFLFSIILNNIKLSGDVLKHFNLPSDMPAFYTVMRVQNSYYTEQLKAHPVLTQLYNTAPNRKLQFSPDYIPSFNIPRPWTSEKNGIYFMLQAELIRPQENDDGNYIKEHPVESLYPTMDALNDLGCVPWSINNPVLDVAIEVFRNGGSLDLDIPLSSTQFDLTPPKNISAPVGSAAYKAILRKKKTEMYSLWCDALYRLSIANHFRKMIFWLPHNLDFRGRAYTIAPYLSHLGGDLGRSLLIFAERKPLGPNGLDWLKIHLINLTGLKKKSSIADRLKYADEIIDDILDSAEKPLTGKMWWAQSEERWQTLAACMELAAALKHPNPEEFLSGFPIHQDGSCNGLQHYAALGRDVMGAKSVNLHPSSVPQDVYSSIATIVEAHRATDAKKNMAIALTLNGHIERKVIKQTIMTTVYGVTKYGSKLQIYKQLKEKDLTEKEAWSGSVYLADVTFKSLESMFKSAREIQQWLVDLAHIISKEYGDNMQWHTPLGLPVLQLYQKSVRNKKTGKKTTDIQLPELAYKSDARKQKNAFAPNFIHSLDSTHMMLTCIKSHKKGITFVAIHDCYWTHACTVDAMNKICREKFVALHSEPILENLAKEVLEYYSSDKWKQKTQTGGKGKNFRQLESHLNQIPEKGKFNIENVLSSTYFFS